jgi:2,4-dienoyl-CoA reductase-like NADH-dependent reductase (Old Yellow Enzyme family)/thioredoxin reductase
MSWNSSKVAVRNEEKMINHFARFKNIYTPIRIGSMEVRNRIEVPPMGQHLSIASCSLMEISLAYYAELSQCGAGIITVADTGIDLDRANTPGQQMGISGEKMVAELNKLTRVLHRYGAKCSIELNHAGRTASQELTRGKPAYAVSQSAKALNSEISAHMQSTNLEVMDIKTIEKLVDTYAEAARICKQSGFDMVMIHCAHGALPMQFLSPLTNQRTDAYGGTPEKRMHFVLEVLQAVKRKCGPNFPVELRVSATEYVQGGLEEEDVITFLQVAQDYMDLVHVSVGANPDIINGMQPYFVPRMLNVPRAARFKAALRIPVVAMGGINSLEDAESVLSNQQADIIAMGRPAIADRRIFIKGLRGLDEDIRPCTRCHKCILHAIEGHKIGCTVNPMVCNEMQFLPWSKAVSPKKIMIIGGGPAGMQAALTAGERGHEVVLYEKENRLGGMLPVIAALPFKRETKLYAEWLVRSVEKSGAKIVLNMEVSPELIRVNKPDAVIVAVGGAPIIPEIPGINGQNVFLAREAYLGRIPAAHNILIGGAGLTGIDCAMALAEEGRDVTIVDMLPVDVWGGGDLLHQARMDILAKNNVKLLPGNCIVEITADGVGVEKQEGKVSPIAADLIVAAFGVRPQQQLTDELSSVIPETYFIGDCYQAKDIYHAIHSAFYCAAAI